ncbi:MAG: SPOR domain-containing protein [Flavobacteriales bacterium]|nr:SPOR domain-containing protein [Flavobacteriales bacterium]
MKNTWTGLAVAMMATVNISLAQVPTDSITRTNPVKVESDERLDRLQEAYEKEGREKGTVAGYRVQIYFGSGTEAKNKANQVKSEVLVKYPELSVYVQWDAPNYKVRVGDCRNRFAAEKLKKDLIETFPACFIVKDDIRWSAIPEE